MVVMAPKDENELKAMLQFGLNYGKGPIAMRYPRGSAVGVAPKKEKIKLGRGEVLREGKDGMIIAIGSMVYPSLEAAEILEKEGIEVGVMNARFIKPLDKLLLRKIVKGTKRIITCEENVLVGGFGSAILEFLEDKRVNIPVLRLGLPDKFVEHGARSILLEKYGLSSRKIAKEIEKFCKR
jgi:1-deoxy-D-xylulose-5-phosphate synthase